MYSMATEGEMKLDTCVENINITSMAYNGKNIQCEYQEILQTLSGLNESKT